MQTPLVVAVALWRVELPKDVELVEGGEDHEDEVPHQQDNPEFLILQKREKFSKSFIFILRVVLPVLDRAQLT